MNGPVLSRAGLCAPRLTTVRAVLLVVVSAFCFAVGHAGAKYLSDDLHPFVIAFWRNFLGLMPFLPWIARNWPSGMRTGRFGLHVVRAIVSAGMFVSGAVVACRAQGAGGRAQRLRVTRLSACLSLGSAVVCHQARCSGVIRRGKSCRELALRREGR